MPCRFRLSIPFHAGLRLALSAVSCLVLLPPCATAQEAPELRVLVAARSSNGSVPNDEHEDSRTAGVASAQAHKFSDGVASYVETTASFGYLDGHVKAVDADDYYCAYGRTDSRRRDALTIGAPGLEGQHGTVKLNFVVKGNLSFQTNRPDATIGVYAWLSAGSDGVDLYARYQDGGVIYGNDFLDMSQMLEAGFIFGQPLQITGHLTVLGDTSQAGTGDTEVRSEWIWLGIGDIREGYDAAGRSWPTPMWPRSQGQTIAAKQTGSFRAASRTSDG